MLGAELEEMALAQDVKHYERTQKLGWMHFIFF